MTYTLKLHARTLPAYWASALINDDWSGLTTAEQHTIERYLALNPQLQYCVDCDGDSFFSRWHDASTVLPYAVECCEYVFHENCRLA